MRGVMIAAVAAVVITSAAVTVLANGTLFAATGASSEAQPAGGPEQIVQGDVDCDGAVDLADALKELRHLAALPVAQGDACPDIGTAAAIPGPQGPPGVSGYELVQVESDETSDVFKSVTADCPEGKSPIGGGARVVAPGGSLSLLSIIESRPVGSSWKATATETGVGTTADWYLEVRVVCASTG